MCHCAIGRLLYYLLLYYLYRDPIFMFDYQWSMIFKFYYCLFYNRFIRVVVARFRQRGQSRSKILRVSVSGPVTMENETDNQPAN